VFHCPIGSSDMGFETICDTSKAILVNKDEYEEEQVVLSIEYFPEGTSAASMMQGFLSNDAQLFDFKLEDLYMVPYLFRWNDVYSVLILIQERWDKLKKMNLIHYKEDE